MKVLIGQKETLPNLEGSTNWVMVYSSANKSGVFSDSNTPVAWSSANSGDNVPISVRTLNFNASKSNAVYQNSAEVKSKNISLKNWKRIS